MNILFSCRLIEEFMLLANMSVAKQIHETMPEIALVRSHKEPSNRILTQTREMLEKFGVILEIESSGALQACLTECESESRSNFAAKCRMLVINSLCAKAMTVSSLFNFWINSGFSLCERLFEINIDRVVIEIKG